MIPKILFLALFCAAHVQGRPASSPHENPDRVVNPWIDVGNTDNMNNNFNPNDSGKYNSDVNAGHSVVIVNSPPNVNKREETYHEVTNDNTNNIPVNHRALPIVMKKILTAKPMIGIDLETNMFKGRLANSPHENPHRVVNVGNEVGNTNHVKENFSLNGGGYHNSDVNGGHNIVNIDSPPEVYKKIETNQIAPNDNANNIPVNHRTPPIVMKKIATAKPVVEINMETNLFKGRLANSPHENPHRVVNVGNEVDNTHHVKENFSLNDGGYHNSDVNGGHNIVIVDSPPEVSKKIETNQIAPNDNANNIPVNHRTPPIVTTKIAAAKPVVEINMETNLFKGRLANSPQENPHRVVNVGNEVDNTNHVKENFSLNDGGYHNSDVNGGHNIVIVDSPPEVSKKIETNQIAPNDNANNIPVNHRTPPIVREKIVIARPVTEERTQKSPVVEFAGKFGHALDVVAKDSVHNVGRGVESVFDVGRSVAGATGTILDANTNLVVPVPRVKASFFGAFG